MNGFVALPVKTFIGVNNSQIYSDSVGVLLLRNGSDKDMEQI